MSIELLPPDPNYPNCYHVRTNYCRCHPETCCCNDWAVHKPGGEKHSTYFHRETAEEVAEALNAKRSNAELTGRHEPNSPAA
jgi:hypothetical protein